MKIIIINGVPTSGKTSFVEFTKDSKYQIYNFSMVDYVKEKAKLLGWDGIKDEKGRRLLSNIKDSLTEYDDIPFKKVIKEIQTVLYKYDQFEQSTDKLIFFVHSREPEDIAKWKELTNAKTLFIRRPAAEDVEHNNHADKNVFDFDYDYVYSNEGSLTDLQEGAHKFINWVGSKDWESHIDF